MVMQNSLESEVMVFTISEESEKLINALFSEANGNIRKIILPENLLLEINNTAEVGSFLHSDTERKMFILFKELEIKREKKQVILSERENEVLTEIALGKKYKQIAETLFLSVHTIRFHMKNIYRKFNIHSQSEAIAIALRKGLI